MHELDEGLSSRDRSLGVEESKSGPNVTVKVSIGIW